MRFVIAAAVLMAASGPALADPCQDRFTAVYMQMDQGGPVTAFITTEFKGAVPMTNDFYYLSQDHSMAVPIEPPLPWTMTYKTGFYQSADQGKSWTKVRDLDPAQGAGTVLADKKTNAATIRNAACSQEDVDGVVMDRLEAKLTVSQGMVTENHYIYWVRPLDGFIARARYETKAPSFEMAITQTMEKAPDMELPVP